MPKNSAETPSGPGTQSLNARPFLSEETWVNCVFCYGLGDVLPSCNWLAKTEQTHLHRKIACATTKLDKDFWLNVFRRGLKTLGAVSNRVGKSEISVFNRVRVWAPQPHLPTQTFVKYPPAPGVKNPSRAMLHCVDLLTPQNRVVLLKLWFNFVQECNAVCNVGTLPAPTGRLLLYSSCELSESLASLSSSSVAHTSSSDEYLSCAPVSCAFLSLPPVFPCRFGPDSLLLWLLDPEAFSVWGLTASS